MRAFTRSEAVQLAFGDVAERDRQRPELWKFYKRADKIRAADGWIPWWLRARRQNVNRGLPKIDRR